MVGLGGIGRALAAGRGRARRRGVTQPFVLPALAYAYGALEPHIDALTMEIHYTKHHRAYITNANKALEGHTELAAMTARGDPAKPGVDRRAAAHRASQQCRRAREPLLLVVDPFAQGGRGADRRPGGRDHGDFGSFDAFKAKLSAEAAMKRFGSGWAWLSREGPKAGRPFDGQPGFADQRRSGPDRRDRRLGARLLPQAPEPSRRLRRRVLDRRRLGPGGQELRRVRGLGAVSSRAWPGQMTSAGAGGSRATFRRTRRCGRPPRSPLRASVSSTTWTARRSSFAEAASSSSTLFVCLHTTW